MDNNGLLVVFDKDGVLLDTERGKILSYWLAITELAGTELNPAEWNEASYLSWHAKNLTGKSRLEVVAGIWATFPAVRDKINASQAELENEILNLGGLIAAELDPSKFSQKYYGIFSAVRMKHFNAMKLDDVCRPIERMIAFANLLRQAGVTLALITESELARTILELKACRIKPEIFKIIACKDKIIDGRSRHILADGGEKDSMYRIILEKTNPVLAWSIEDTDKGRIQSLKAEIPCFQIFYPG